jgi:hypothetical protein
MNNKLNAKEREHLARVKELPCGLCGEAGPSEAHHIEQHKQYLCIPLCPNCHRGPHNGWHGAKAMWRIKKKTEMDVLNETIATLLER